MAETQEPINRRPDTKWKVLIVGAGTAGCLLALELKRLGFSSTLLERKEQSEMTGDFVVLGPSAVKILRYWPQLKAEFDQLSHDCEAYQFRHNGKFITGPYPLSFSTGRPILRRNLQILLEAAVNRQSIPIKFDHKVVDYFEEDNCAGVLCANGQRLTADIIVAADGFQTRSWKVINGRKNQPVSSGLAAFRATMPMKSLLRADPLLYEKFQCRDGKPYLKWYCGPNTHIIVFAEGETLSYVIMHPENANTSKESWSATVDTKTVVEQIKQHHPDWAPEIVRVVSSTPDNTINDWLLMMRDPQPNWVSPKGRVIACGDSAHPYLPTSANGAVQAMEDVVSLAAALRLGIDKSVSLKESATVYNEIRFVRTSCAQLMGISNGQTMHHTDWEKVIENPKILIENGPGKWVSSYDPEAYMLENYDACLECVRAKRPFKNTNIPSGFEYKPWNARDLFEQERNGEMLVLEGDWK